MTIDNLLKQLTQMIILLKLFTQMITFIERIDTNDNFY